ncbi:MAG: DNA-3-methyladenine glycosylase [bacterium]|jgi:DNA-3-methyladenine glycosylase
MIFKKLDKSFYVRGDTVKIARELLGKYLMTDIDGKGLTGGKIVETEAYLGAIDKASHGYGNKKTERNKNLYKEGGYSYVYFIYGMYYLFNVVTGKENFADAVLIRAIEPEIGIDIMLERRNKNLEIKNKENTKRITSGPGLLTVALGINLKHNGIPICEQNILKNKGGKDGSLEIWLEDRNINIGEDLIISTPRIGVDYAAEHAKLPYRFKIKDNGWASR